MPKPAHLTREEAAPPGLVNSTAYRQLVSRNGGDMKQGDNVLIWGASDGLGGFATQYALNGGATPICVVSSEDKAEICRKLGAELIINRNDEGYKFTSAMWARPPKLVSKPQMRCSGSSIVSLWPSAASSSTARPCATTSSPNAMQEILDAILANDTDHEEFAHLELPDHYRAAYVSKDDVKMFEGMASRDKDPRKSLHVGDVALPELGPGEAYDRAGPTRPMPESATWSQ